MSYSYAQKPRPMDGAFYSGGSDGDRRMHLPELHSGRSHELLDVSSILFLFDFLFTL
jgi:hypothetical protein